MAGVLKVKSSTLIPFPKPSSNIPYVVPVDGWGVPRLSLALPSQPNIYIIIYELPISDIKHRTTYTALGRMTYTWPSKEHHEQ